MGTPITQDDYDFLRQNFDKFNRQEQERAVVLLENYKKSRIPETTLLGDAPAQRVGGMAYGVGEGLAKGALSLAEYATLGADAMVNDINHPEATANINAAQQFFKQKRDQLDQVSDEVYTGMFNGRGRLPGNLIGEGIIYAPLNYIAGGTTFLRALAGNATAGALAAGASAAHDAETLSDTFGASTLGILFGGGLTVGTQSLAGIRAFLGRQWMKEQRRLYAQNSLKLEKQIQQLTGDENFSFSLAQIAGDNPWLIGAERGAVGREAIRKQNRNLQALVDYLDTKSSNMSPREVVDGLSNVIQQTAAGIRRNASRNYARAVDHIIDSSDGELVLDGKRYLDSLNRLQSEMTDVMAMGGRMPPRWARHVREVDQLVKPYEAVREAGPQGAWVVRNKASGEIISRHSAASEARANADRLIQQHGGLTAEEVERILKGHNAVMQASDSFFDSAKYGSLDNAVRAVNGELLYSMRGTSSGAVQALNRARQAYRTDMTKLSEFENSMLARTIGTSRDEVLYAMSKPEEVLDRLVSLDDPEALAKTRRILEATAPDLLDDLKSVLIRRAVRSSADPTKPRAQLQQDMLQLANELSGAGPGVDTAGFLGYGLFSPAEQSHIRKTADAIRTLATTYVKRVDRDAPGIAADTAINLVSQTHEFMARYVVRLFAKSETLEHLLVDPKAREALVAIAEHGPGSRAAQSAVAYLAFAEGIAESDAQFEASQKVQEEAAKAQGQIGVF